ncbi:MBL fold metallo-hydrolase [Phycicoccus flavus]|uniref:MBL fold metallo-hydrolase n=1 Tax=Phycicoccus flavus TaxID=2502783 RepID=A0A8T6RAB6_9MICO|nr:MBL fold metallo-hydrolase [Phycicoccus flavus]NHA70340.1 MBL fold metallo-hydrolase [Phycicoccus flavus]
MQITHLGHSCLLVEMAGSRVLIDPGAFSEDFTGLRDLDAVIVTHQHPDHLDADRVPALLSGNPDARVLTDPGSVDVLAGLGVEAQTHDGVTEVGGVRVTPVGRTHALIHDDVPRIPNVGVRLDADGEPSLYHPGDALDADPGEVDVLAFPLMAPWARSRDMTGFLRRLGAPRAVPIHDALLKEAGRNLYLGQARDLGSERTEIVDLAGRGAVTFE